MVQNNAARLVFKRRKYDSVSPLLHKLHWLPIMKRIEYKIATICYNCINGTAPVYLSDLVSVSVP